MGGGTRHGVVCARRNGFFRAKTSGDCAWGRGRYAAAIFGAFWGGHQPRPTLGHLYTGMPIRNESSWRLQCCVAPAKGHLIIRAGLALLVLLPRYRLGRASCAGRVRAPCQPRPETASSDFEIRALDLFAHCGLGRGALVLSSPGRVRPLPTLASGHCHYWVTSLPPVPLLPCSLPTPPNARPLCMLRRCSNEGRSCTQLGVGCVPSMQAAENVTPDFAFGTKLVQWTLEKTVTHAPIRPLTP